MATNSKTKKKTTRKKNTKSKIDVAGLVKKSLFLVVAMAWAFILGVLVGKGYKPENAVPEIARIMPAPPSHSAQKPKVLKAEELDFYERLKNSKPAQEKTVPVRTKKPVTAKKRSTPAKPQARAITPPRQTKKAATKPKQTTRQQETFKYTYQVAAFRSEIEAMRLQQKIIGLGIAAFVGKPAGGWYRLTVRFRGTPVETRKLKAKLKTLGIAKPILRGKKAV